MSYKPKILEPADGGTGVANTGTITLGGNLTTSGAFTTTLTVTGNTNVTLPTSGTLATTASIPALPLSLANGGTAANLTASNGGIFYSTASAGAILAGTATAGKVLQSGSSTTPTWSTAVYPATAGTTGNYLVSDGTNWNSTSLLQLQTKTVVLTSSQVKNLHGTPVEFIAAPGAGKVIVILGSASKLTFGTNAFVAGASQVISLTYGTGTNAVTNLMSNATIVASSSSYNIPASASVTNTTAVGLQNLAVNLYNSTATEISGNAANDNTITVTAFYYILNI